MTIELYYIKYRVWFVLQFVCDYFLFLSFKDHGVIKSDRVFDAMLATDRGMYSKDYPYVDSPQSIGKYEEALLLRG